MALLTSLGAERLALLQQIHLAKVIIESLKIPPESIQISPRRKGLLGKPPRPMSVHKWWGGLFLLCLLCLQERFPWGLLCTPASPSSPGFWGLAISLLLSGNCMPEMWPMWAHFRLCISQGFGEVQMYFVSGSTLKTKGGLLEENLVYT